MTTIESLPLTVIKKLIKQEFAEVHPEYDIAFGALNIDDDDLEPYEDGELTMQSVRVMLHVDTPDDDDRNICWHPWTLSWDCDRSEFVGMMRDDQVQHIAIYEELENKEEWSTDKSYEQVIDFAPIHSIKMHQVLSNNDPVYEYEDGAQKRTVMDVLEHIYDYLCDHKMNDRYEGHDVVIDKLHVHEDGSVYVTFSRLDDEE